ncbi:hypothetical protein IFM89_021960 [Coptis chinensis]|uniref:Fe2OG dioxygenase domain-containing protein n=1 Tax=Coptis chinensis TaxID=261450 RepID=A0A835HCG4_9MAGN|nr:hypothetical protein IFM89_021960 [Coptis chinensis]
MSLTRRQRALQSGKDASTSLIEFPNGLPPAPPTKHREKLTEVEQQLKKAEAAQKRRVQVAKAAKESEAEAIRKILGQDSNRKKREDKLKKRRDELAKEKAANAWTLPPNTIRWVIRPTRTFITFSEDVGLPSIFSSKPCRLSSSRGCQKPSSIHMRGMSSTLKHFNTHLQRPSLLSSETRLKMERMSKPLDWKLVGCSIANEARLNSDIAKLSLSGSNIKVSADEKSSSMSLPEEQKRMSLVGRKKNFECVERVKGRRVNVLQGLELHTRVFNDEEQKKIVEYVYDLQRMGQSRELRERTYLEPQKWMRGKGRVTIQFGCCYNYAVDKKGRPPGIIRDEEVDPIPPLFKSMIKRMVKWRILPTTCIPNSCIVNIYNEGDCIPPHIDHHDFVRPFCTVSFLTESNILFGTNLRPVGEGEFSGAAKIPLPVGSVLILKGNGADVAKHCVPAVHKKRISITFRKMDDSKLPFKFSPDPGLQGIQPLGSSQMNKLPAQQVPSQQNSQNQNQMSNLQNQNRLSNSQNQNRLSNAAPDTARKMSRSPTQFGNDDFPPLCATR